jgi:AraC-like DNA-binding protein
MNRSTLYIKNRVCPRCVRSVQGALDELGIPFREVRLGEVELVAELPDTARKELEKHLQTLGFELIDNRRQMLVDKIKKAAQVYVENLEADKRLKLSAFIADALHYEYTYLSDLFSTVEGLTIEAYFIRLRIEKAKELLVYDELTLSQIADRLGYSSTAHLSAQFKQVTGLTPTFFKKTGKHKREMLDAI